MIGSGCDCFEDGRYPCQECQRETFGLLALLRSVKDDAIAATTRVYQRRQEIPRGCRQP
jgi:hypothetical protein